MARSIRLIIFTLLLFGLLIKHPTLVQAQSLTSLSFNSFHTGSNKVAGLPFPITITARDENGQTLSSFNDSVTLFDSTGTLYPTETSSFQNGVWSGFLYVTRVSTNDVVTATYSTVSAASGSFAIDADSRTKFLAIISGNNQTQVVGTALANALVLKVVDPYNNPLPNIGVNFAISSMPPNSTGQIISNNSSTTNVNGQAQTTFTFGRRAGTYIITGTITSGITNAVNFYENALAGVLMSISLTPPIGIVPAGSFMPFTVKGFDQYSNELTPPTVTWSLQNGGGTIDPTGIFYAGSTLGTYSNTIKAVVGGIGSTATVTVVGAAGEAGGTATSAGVLLPTPIPTLTPMPTPTLAPGVLYDVQVDPSVIAALVKAKIPILAEGVDLFGNRVQNVTYDFQVSGNLGSLLQTGGNTAILTTNGAGLGTVTVSATQGNVTRSTTIAGSVGNGINRRLVIEDIPSPQSVNVPFTISIAAKDSDNNFVTDYAGPIVLADTTGTIDPAVVQPNNQGIWYVQAVIKLANPEVSVTTAGDGMVGVSNIFEVIGEPQKSSILPGLGGLGGGEGGQGAGAVLGASISAILDRLLLEKNLNKYSVFRYIGAGIAAGVGILGVSIGGGIMVSRGLEALGRNPFAKAKLQFNLYASLGAFIIAAACAVLASYLILQ
jgi:F0F1-type ATP synthase membrane subunit c/vacuolar-type H+-ATPase subunit K